MQFQYEPFNKAWATKFLTSHSDSLCLAVRNAIGLATQFVLREARIRNRSGGAAHVGIGGRIPQGLWLAGQMTAAGVYTEDSADAQDADANDFALTTTTTNDGFAIFCLIPFNIVSVVVGTAASGGSPAYDLQYTKAGGSWGTLANAYVDPAWGSTGEQLIWFEPPTDWAVSEAGHGTNVPVGYYGIRPRATTAPSVTAALATNMVLGRMLRTLENLANGGEYDFITGNEGELLLPPQCDALCAAISVANAQNNAFGQFRLKG